MDHLNQENVLKLKSLREKVKWKIERSRDNLLEKLVPLIKDWKGQLPNLQDIFCPKEIDQLLSDCVTRKFRGRYLIAPKRKQFMEFVIRTGYKDKPDDDQDHKPSSRRSTPVHIAFKCFHDLLIVQDLFKIYNRFDVNYTDESGLTHFHVACAYGLDEIVKKFLELGQDPNCVNQETGDTPLLAALDDNNKEVARLLLRSGADPNLANKNGITPLHFICQEESHIDSDLTKMLFELSDDKYQPVQINAQNKWGDTPLHCITKLPFALPDCKEKIFEFLLRLGADPNLANSQGSTPLHLICQRKYRGDDLAELFFEINDDIDQTIQVDARDKFGNTPLYVALYHSNNKVAEILLKRGADSNLANADGWTPLHVMSERNRSIGLTKILFKLSKAKNWPVQVNAREKSGNTPLHSALSYNNHKVATLLLKNGADPNLANEDGETPLHIICMRSCDDDLLEIFFKICNDIKQTVQVNAQDKLGRTSLHYALYYGHKKMTESLLRRGSDPNVANEKGSTPLHVISKANHDNYELVKLFFKINDERKQKLQVDARDKKGRSALQWAVANVLPGVVDVFLDHGADLSSFVFPRTNNFKKCFKSHGIEDIQFKLRSTSGAVPVVECLEKRGYVLDLSDAITIMKLFINQGLFAKSVDVGNNRYDEKEFVNKAKEIMINSSLSLYNLIRLRPEEAVKLLTYTDCLEFSCSKGLLELPEGPKEACTTHLCEIMSRGFFRRWALESFWKLIWYRLPIECCEMIIEPLMNEDLYNICLANKNRNLENSQNNVMKNVKKFNNQSQKICKG
uniref:Uncharacterized protein n=1 Tax=Trichogramma kaykai TaxID=54128 RepID=A0ABD2WCP8_9HYME